jgi:uncharacterized membrane protein YdjX (TVP38/TMEM64 family)
VPRRTLIALALLAALALMVFVWASDWLTLEWLRGHRDDLVAFCRANMALTIAAYIGTFVAIGVLCIPGGGVLTLMGGLLFGLWGGVAIATVSAVLGATAAFLVARHLLRDWAHQRFARTFAMVDRGVERDGAFYLFMLRVVIVVPFFVVNPVMGLTAMPTTTFIGATFAGMLVNTFVWVNAGTMLGHINSLDDIFSLRSALGLALVGVLPLLLKWLFFRGK